MPAVSEIQADDFEELYRKYLEHDDPRLSSDDWQSLFRPVCSSVDQPVLGYKLTHDSKIVGMLGMILSCRQIVGQQISFCNLHSWFVDEDHRGSSLLLMRPLLRMNNHVITDFSPTPAVIQISQRLGFQIFTIPQRILVSVPRSKLSVSAETELDWDDEIDTRLLESSDRILFADHNNERFHRLLIRSGSETAFLIVRKISFHWRPYASILYSSNPELMVSTQGVWQESIRERLSIKRIVGPEKYLHRHLSGSFRVPFPNPQLFRSTNHGPEIIDTLYTEVSELGLTTLPGLKTLSNPLNWFRGKTNH